MHFIVGYEFIVNPRSSNSGTRNGTRIISIAPQQQVQSPKAIGKFERGLRYCLYFIAKNKENKFVYTFVSEKREAFQEVFDTVSDAEKLISELSGATIPDYASFHARKL